MLTHALGNIFLSHFLSLSLSHVRVESADCVPTSDIRLKRATAFRSLSLSSFSLVSVLPHRHTPHHQTHGSFCLHTQTLTSFSFPRFLPLPPLSPFASLSLRFISLDPSPLPPPPRPYTSVFLSCAWKLPIGIVQLLSGFTFPFLLFFPSPFAPLPSPRSVRYSFVFVLRFCPSARFKGVSVSPGSGFLFSLTPRRNSPTLSQPLSQKVL